MLKAGKILAIKGLGGFHLACDACNPKAVSLLRERKLRIDKPFALMVNDCQIARKYCDISDNEQTILESRQRPIVILAIKDSTIAPDVAPGQNTLGLMLPYTPLHYLLLEPQNGFPEALVMTSGNFSEEPIAFENKEAKERLDIRSLMPTCCMTGISTSAATILWCARIRRQRVNRSFIRCAAAVVMPPTRYCCPGKCHQFWQLVLSLKNTFCLTKENYAFLSHHIGDLENYEALKSYEHGYPAFPGFVPHPA